MRDRNGNVVHCPHCGGEIIEEINGLCSKCAERSKLDDVTHFYDDCIGDGMGRDKAAKLTDGVFNCQWGVGKIWKR